MQITPPSPERRADQPPGGHHQTVVIGAGVTGLVCAAYLARAGMDVLVVEARDQVGGVASTNRLLGASMDIRSRDQIAYRSSPVFEELALREHGLRFIDIEPAMIAMSWQGGSPFVLFQDAAQTLDAMSATHRYEVSRYEAYLEAALPVVDLLTEFEIDGTRARAPRRRRDEQHTAWATLLKWRRRSAADVLSSFFESEALRTGALTTVLAAAGHSPGLSGSGPAAVAYAAIHRGGVGRADGAGSSLPHALAAAATSAGAQIRTGARVDQIMASDDGVTGVRLLTGEEIEATNVVVACDPRKAVLQWLRPVPLGATPLIRRWEAMSKPIAHRSRLDLVVDGVPARRADVSAVLSQLGVDDAAATTTAISPTSAALMSSYRLAHLGAVPNRPPMTIASPSAADPSLRTGDAHHVMAIDVMNTPHEISGGWGYSEEPARWIGLAADAFGQDLRDRIVRWRATTPPEYDAMGLDPRGGVTGADSLPVAGLPRRRGGPGRSDTPVDGLHLCRAPALGLPITGVAGRNVANSVLASVGDHLTSVA